MVKYQKGAFERLRVIGEGYTRKLKDLQFGQSCSLNGEKEGMRGFGKYKRKETYHSKNLALSSSPVAGRRP